MKPIEFDGSNYVFLKNKKNIPAKVVTNDPQGLVITKWELTPEEMELIKETGTIHLSMFTFNQPLQPVLLTVGFPTQQQSDEQK